MGGAEGAGNVTPCAEYNFHCDAESAHLVMCKFPQLVLVSWNATVRHALPWCWVDAWLGKPTRKAAFMRAIMAASMALEKERDAGRLQQPAAGARGRLKRCGVRRQQGRPLILSTLAVWLPAADAGWIACDPLAFALAVCDEALLAAEPKHCVVELQVWVGGAAGTRFRARAAPIAAVPAVPAGLPHPRHERVPGAGGRGGAACQRAAGHRHLHAALPGAHGCSHRLSAAAVQQKSLLYHHSALGIQHCTFLCLFNILLH